MASLRERVKGQTTRRTGAQADPAPFITRAEEDDPRGGAALGGIG